MDEFAYRDGILHAERVDTRRLATEFGTPLYVYSRQTLVDHYDRLVTAFQELNATVCFSVKSCSNLAILRLVSSRGAWFDVVSGGELQRVLEAGAEARRIVFAGVGKCDDELCAALKAGIAWFNVESFGELERLAELAAASTSRPRVALRINPDVDAGTHRHTTTGTRFTKFGVTIDRAADIFKAFASDQRVRLAGLHLHIGSPVNDVEPYVAALTRALQLVGDLRAAGHRLESINLGGGFGAHYDGSEAPPAVAYARRLVPLLAGRGLDVLLEPGRCISANAGVLLTRVLYTKDSAETPFVIVDAAMTDLIRPALYDAFHFVWPIQPVDFLIPPARARDVRIAGTSKVHVVGPVCESGDFLAKDRYLPALKRGDLLAVFSAGAYGFSMSNQYNSRPRAAEVLVEGDHARLIRRRESYDDLVGAERL